MKVFIILLVSCCVSIPSKIVNADIGSDIDFELYKHLDVSPIHTSYDHDVDDFDDDHTTFDSTYDGGGSDIHDDDNNTDDDDDNNNQSGDVEKSKKSDENNSNVDGAKKNSADYDNNNSNDDNDDGENNEGTENDDPNDDDDDNDDGGDDNDDDDDDDDEEEKGDESKIEATTIKAIDPRGTETVDPESFHYISPHDVSHRLSRQKRSKKTDKSNAGKDYDFAQSYRDFVREHFGVDDAQTLSDKKKKKENQHDDDENDNGEVEEDEDYEEGAEDGETADDDDSNKSGTTASAPADDYYNDDDNDDDGNDDGDDDTQDDDYENDSGNISDEDEDYKKVKKLSQDTDENPEFCKTVYKNNQECQVCRNPKTKDKSETCSYSSSPSPKRYAYKKEKNYNSNDDFGDPEDSDSEIIKPKKKSKKSKAKKNKSKDFDDDFSNGSTQKKAPKSKSKTKSKKHSKKNKRSKENTESSLTGGFQPSYPYYHGYQDRRTTTPLQNHYFGDNENDDLSFRASESLPVTASSENYETDVDIFKGRDWSQCSRKINNEGLTCYYCKDAHGATQEECMYIAGNDDDSPLRGKTKKQSNNNKNKRVKKFKRNNQSNRKSSVVTTTISTNRITTPTTTTRTTLIPKIITTTLRPYDTKNINLKQQEDSNRFNINLNTAPTSSVSSVSWQTNHNYQHSPHQQPRTLNRNQNFAITNVPIPILRQNINTNPLRITVPYGSPTGSESNIPNLAKSSDPVKTLEYTEPRNRETLKRMIKLRITNDHDSDKLPSNLNADNDATVFYSKVLRKF